MQTIIMTVGTSLRTNPDRDLPLDKKRPWVASKDRFNNHQTIIEDRENVIAWMESTDMEIISAETNTLSRLNITPTDTILLLHSDTISGQECAEVIKVYLKNVHGQENVYLHKIPGINYDLDESGSSLEKMAELLRKLIAQAQGIVTLAATGGFKAQTIIMGLVGNAQGVPVCYIHEEYKGLIYLPCLSASGQTQHQIRCANLPDSTKPRAEVINVQESKKHHRPKSWQKIAKMLREIPWVEYVRFDENAFSAPKNGLRKSPRLNNILWIHLYESEKSKMAVSVDTTAITLEQQQQASIELNERMGRLLS